MIPHSKPIEPVGPDDSGVSDAPTRLREAEVVAQAGPAGAAIAGSRSRSMDQDTRIYGGSIRPSRIMPWLVSLGLAAGLLFVLAQLFQPLFDRPRAEVDQQVAEASSADSLQETASEPSVPGEPSVPAATEQANGASLADAGRSVEPELLPTPADMNKIAELETVEGSSVAVIEQTDGGESTVANDGASSDQVGSLPGPDDAATADSSKGVMTGRRTTLAPPRQERPRTERL